ncbi:MAG: hypothetical protein J7521_07680 [Caulobacter sp.]|nr:hypothetical protein [Caulobacter sp.]
MIPEHYSRDIPERCDALIDLLSETVEQPQVRFGGPLKTTFLLAMAMPMILLPWERLFQRGKGGKANPAAEHDLDKAMTDEVVGLIGAGKLAEEPFFEVGAWALASRQTPFKVGREWPYDLAEELASADAADAATALAPKVFLSILRNALAHGAITYLDQTGYQAGGEAQMFGFVAKQDYGALPIHVLRVDKDAFRRFLRAWAQWLRQAGVQDLLGEGPALAAE